MMDKVYKTAVYLPEFLPLKTQPNRRHHISLSDPDEA